MIPRRLFDSDRSFPWPLQSYMGRAMEDHFRDMERMMDGMFGNRVWERSPVAGKEVSVKYDNKEFEVKLDVSQYAPDELTVKVTDHQLVVSGSHQQKADKYGYVKREFTRRVVVPEDVEVDTLESTLTNDGYLVVSGRVKGAPEDSGRTLEIKRQENASEDKETGHAKDK